ncbi:MAG: hypothetical protein A2W26_05850 [Acidobacteria bacterium RBG_16_64_8]|nr:MAG: hypothetical protein A2W26_05850 [Acidobacteria bacterium RBG_16_64_8]
MHDPLGDTPHLPIDLPHAPLGVDVGKADRDHEQPLRSGDADGGSDAARGGARRRMGDRGQQEREHDGEERLEHRVGAGSTRQHRRYRATPPQED